MAKDKDIIEPKPETSYWVLYKGKAKQVKETPKERPYIKEVLEENIFDDQFRQKLTIYLPVARIAAFYIPSEIETQFIYDGKEELEESRVNRIAETLSHYYIGKKMAIRRTK